MANINKIMELLDKSHSQFHVVNNLETELLNHGFIKLSENSQFDIKLGHKYYVTRNDSSLIAFTLPRSIKDYHYQITAAHNDSPTFKLKHQPIIKCGNMTSLNVEPYGGMIMPTWLDRPLSIAGRILIKGSGKIESRLIDVDKDLLMIPNLAIHMNRDINNGHKYNPTCDTIPLLTTSEKPDLNINEILGLDTNTSIISTDLYLYNRDKARIFGLNDEFLSSPRIDDLISTYSCLLALVKGNNNSSINVLAAFDNEEVGSLTRQGANSTFLKDVLRRINLALNHNEEEFYQAIAKSSLLSVDGAHAMHPNFPSYSDQDKVLLNKGIVIKYNANQSYTTDALSSSIVKTIAEYKKINVQQFANKNDIRGGSTLGNISNSEISLVSADIGIGQLAMHSANEMCGINDINDMFTLLNEYYSMNITVNNGEITFEK